MPLDIGVRGDTDAGVGVHGSALGAGTGVRGVASETGTGVYGIGGTAVLGDGGATGIGLQGASVSGYGLHVTGKVKLANRSGRLPVAQGKTSITKSVSGVTSSNIVIAVLQTAETGTWVRAAVAGAGRFTVYFNKALPSSSVVGWIILG